MTNHVATPMLSDEPTASLLLESARLGRVGLIVSDLQRSLDFYAGVIGLDTLSQTPDFARLGVAEEKRVLLELEQGPGVHPLPGKRLGLFHTALLLPSREALASFADCLARRGIFAASSDHVVSEAFYLADPDGLQIEVYADRERKVWPWRGAELAVATLPLNLPHLLATPHPPWKGASPGASIGHIHLSISDLKRADLLYRQGLGLNVRTHSFPGALFLAAGDYHHHVGLNTWAGAVPAASDADPRLSWWELIVPQRQIPALREQMCASGWQYGRDGTLVDSWGNSLRLTSDDRSG